MANKTLFQTVPGTVLPKADARNEAGGPTFTLPPRHALAQYAVTGCLSATFYAGAEAQLDHILALAGQVDPAFVAKTAIYCRTRGYMKDTPAVLCAALATLDVPLLERVFDRVIESAFRARNPRARLVCLDIQPYTTTQATERADILNVGGFSDEVFEIVSAFAQGDLRPGHWVEQIDQIEL